MTGCDHDGRFGCQAASCFAIDVISVRFLSSFHGTDPVFRRYHAVDRSRVSRVDGERFGGVEYRIMAMSHPRSLVAERGMEHG